MTMIRPLLCPYVAVLLGGAFLGLTLAAVCLWWAEMVYDTANAWTPAASPSVVGPVAQAESVAARAWEVN